MGRRGAGGIRGEWSELPFGHVVILVCQAGTVALAALDVLADVADGGNEVCPIV